MELFDILTQQMLLIVKEWYIKHVDVVWSWIYHTLPGCYAHQFEWLLQTLIDVWKEGKILIPPAIQCLLDIETQICIFEL